MANGTKDRRTYYTPDRVDAIRRNVEQYEWASERAKDAVARAECALDDGLEDLWSAVPGQRIPRAGLAGDGNGRETWFPVEGRAWTITDGEWTLPTNDFAAYRESGRDDRGFFDPELADDDLLVNEAHPEMGATWGVDDGTGFVDEDGDVVAPGTVLVPVAFYNHFYRWYDLWDDLEALRDAFLYTGERRYARAGCVLLDRIADEYPRMDIGEFSNERFWNSHGGTGEGKIVGSIWETNLVRNLLSAYDAFFPAFDDEELVAFLESKPQQYPGLLEKSSVGAIRGNVERGIVREVLPAVERTQIRGNFGMHQATLAMAAVVMDEPDGYTAAAMEFLYRPGELRTVDGIHFREVEGELPTKEWELTGGDFSSALIGRLDRDGYGDEAAPNYNLIVRSHLARVADILYRYEPPKSGGSGDASGLNGDRYDLYTHPKLRRAMRNHYSMVLLDRYMPSIGDSGLTGNPDRMVDTADAVRGFERYEDPAFARVAHLFNGEDAADLYGDPFSADADSMPDRIQDVVDAHGIYAPGSVLEPSYGFAALRQGTRDDGHDTRRTATLYFGRNSFETGTSHCHANALDLGLYANGLALAPDLGYPEHTGDWPKHDWVKGTVSHNTVVVDGRSQDPIRVGNPRLFDDAGVVSVVDVDAPGAYAETDEYRRTTAVVRIDEEASYVADVFRVDGGDDHLFSFHGAEGSTSADALDLTSRPGTYAGRDVSMPDHGEKTAYNRQIGNGFNYLQNITRDDSPPEAFAVDWDVEDTWNVFDDDNGELDGDHDEYGGDRDVHLRLAMLGDLDHVALADGEPPRKEGNPESLRYLLARRTGTDLRTAFRSVIEPYVDQSRIVDVATPTVEDGSNVEGDPDVEAIRIELDTGRTDWIASAGSPDAEYTIDGRFSARGSFAFYAERDGAPVRAYLSDGTRLRAETAGETLIERDVPTLLAGRVVDFTRDLSRENRIVVATDGPVDLDGAVGRHLHVATEDGDNGVYEIVYVERDGDRVIVGVGDATTIEDVDDGDGEYEYVISEGVRARVPAGDRWNADGA